MPRTKAATLSSMHAAASGNLVAVKVLIEKGADVNAKTSGGYTALRVAAWTGNLELVNLLVGNGADVNSRGPEGETLLVSAANSGNPQVVEFFIIKGLSVNARDESGETVLMHAVRWGHLDLMRDLISKEAGLNTEDESGEAVRTAASRKSLKMLKYLIDEGADVKAKDKTGRTALTIACEDGNLEVVKLLASHGADLHAKGVNGNNGTHARAQKGIQGHRGVPRGARGQGMKSTTYLVTDREFRRKTRFRRAEACTGMSKSWFAVDHGNLFWRTWVVTARALTRIRTRTKNHLVRLYRREQHASQQRAISSAGESACSALGNAA